MNNTRPIKIFIGTMIAATTCTVGYAAFISHARHAYLGLAVLALAAATSRMKVKLPGIDGNMSVNLPFLLTAVVNLSAAEAVLITAVSTAVQCWPKKHARFNSQQMTFNLSMMMFASSAAWLAFHAAATLGLRGGATGAGLLLPTLALFLGQTAPVAGIVAVSERKTARQVWWTVAHLSFPYYVLSAGVTCMVQAMSSHIGWALALAAFPVMYGIHRSYRTYFVPSAETVRTNPLVRVAAAGAQ